MAQPESRQSTKSSPAEEPDKVKPKQVHLAQHTLHSSGQEVTPRDCYVLPLTDTPQNMSAI